MAGSRTLKLSILADVDDLKSKLGDGEKTVDGFGGKLEDFGKKAGLAFAAATAAAALYAGKLLVDGVKSALEDEAAQAKLAGTLKRVADASDATVAAVEKFITKTSIATGVTDDNLRPAFDRLVRSTGDVEKAQQALQVALDISAATGKDLNLVTQAIGRSLDGNSTSLGKVAGGFEAADLKGKSFSDLLPILAERFGGAATAQAETFQGKLDRLNIAFNEAKETVGSYVIDALTPLVSLTVDNVIPAFEKYSDVIGKNLQPIISNIADFIKNVFIPNFKDFYNFINEKIVPLIRDYAVAVFRALGNAFESIRTAIDNNKEKFQELYEALKPIIEWMAKTVVPILKTGVSVAIQAIGSGLSVAINAFGALASAITKVLDGIKGIINLVKSNPIVSGISGLIDKVFGGGKAMGGAVNSSSAYLVGERGPELFVPNNSGTIIPNNRLNAGTTINLNVTGAIDPEGTARTIIDALNQSFARGTLGSLAFRG